MTDLIFPGHSPHRGVLVMFFSLNVVLHHCVKSVRLIYFIADGNRKGIIEFVKSTENQKKATRGERDRGCVVIEKRAERACNKTLEGFEPMLRERFRNGKSSGEG